MKTYHNGKTVGMGTIAIYIRKKIGVFLSLFLFSVSLPGYSQTCEVTLRNDSLIDANNLIVDIYVRATSGTFYYSWGQYKISFNSAITNGGTITGTIVDGFSDLTNSTQLPASIIVGSTSWRATAGPIPGSQAACSQISATGYGTRICRIRLNNTAVFAASAADMLVVTTVPNATAVWYADAGGFSVAAAATMVNGNLINPVLNGSLSLFNVTGGGTAPTPVGLSGSQTPGVNYLLLRDGSVSGSAVSGTGSAISFGNQVAGTYGVRAHRIGTYMYSDMSGIVAVTEACAPVSISSQPVSASMCSGGSTTFSVTAGGTSPYTYQWQYYNGSSWVSVTNGTPAGAVYANATTATLGVSGITGAGAYQYHCYVTNCSGGYNATSNAATLSVLGLPSASVSGTTAVCQGSSSPNVTFTNPQALPVTITYNINGSNQSTINVGASTTATLPVSTATAGVFAYNLVSVAYQSAPACSTAASGTATVTVNAVPSVTNQTTSISSGGTFTVTPAGVPVGTTYTWPVPTYTGGVTGGAAQATGATSISGTLTVPSGSGTATYTVTPRSGTCVGNTFTVTVTVTSTCAPVSISSQPVSSSMCSGGSTTFSVTAGGTSPYTYQWQYYDGSSWVSVTNGTPAGAVYANATTSTLGVSGITGAGAYQYHCYVTNCSGGYNATSNAATLSVLGLPSASVSGTTAVCQGSSSPNVTFTNPQALPVTITYNINGSNQSTINVGASTTATLLVSTATAGVFAYNIVSVAYQSAPACSTAASGTATVTVNAVPSVTNQTTSISSGGTFTVTPAGVPVGTTYTWPVPTYTGGVTGGAAQATGATSISGTLTIPSGSGTATYTVTPRSGTCVGNTFTVTVTVTSTCVPVVITSDPANASICAGESASFSITATGTTPAYQWQYYNGSTWVSVANGTPAGAVYANATTATLGVSGITAAGSYQYRCSATNCTTSSDISNTATLTVNANPPQPVITADGPLTFCTGEDVVLTAPESSSYLWSTGAITRSITVTTGGSFTVQVTNAAGCQSVVSATTVVTVNPLPSRPTITPSGSVTICAGSSQTLTSSAGVSYLWSNGETTQGISVNTTGSYTVQVTNSFGCLSTASLPTTVTVNPIPAPPTVTASGATTFCTGGSVTLTSSVSSTYLWSTGATTRSIIVNSTGNYWVRVADAASCQSAQSATTAVTVNPLPSAPTIGTITQPTCTVSTGSVILSGLPSTGTWTLTRNPGGATQTGTGTSYTATGIPAGNYTFTVTNSNGCTSAASAQVVINTQPAVPTAPIVGAVTQPTCAVSTGSVGFSGLPSTGIWTLTRLPDGDISTGTGTTATVTGIPSGSYTFTLTNAAGCTSPATGTVTINAPLPVPAAPVQTVDCALGFNQAAVTVTSPVGAGYEYRLDAGTYQTGTSFTNVTNGNHTITVRNSSGCTTTGTTFSINCGCVNPPLLTLTAASGSTCGVTAVTVSGNTFGGSATSVTITENGGGTVTPASSSASPFSFTYTPTAADAGRTVVITVTTNNPLGSPCAAASATYTLTVNAIPAAPLPGTVTQPTCAVPAGSVMLNNLPASGDWTITRTPGGTTTTGSGTSTTITGLAPGTYTFTVTNSLGCTSPASSNVVINVQPDTPSAPVVGTITPPTCALSTGSVALSGLPATGTWTLTRTPGNAITTGTGTTRTISGIPPGTYTFTVANAAGCVSPASAEVVIVTQPVTPAAPAIGTITHPTCELSTGSILLDNMPATGEWTLTRYPGGITSTGTGTSTTISSLAAGTYNFAVTNADGCTSSVSANAVINAQPPTPTAPVVGTITHPTLTVATGSVVLSGLPTTGTWTLTRYPDGFTSQGTGTTRTVSGLEPGTYTFTVTNSVGCTSAATGDIVINARPGAPVVVINNPPNICSDQTADLTQPAVTAGSDPNLTYTYWRDAAATLTLTNPAAVPSGTYYIMGTSTAGYSTTRPVVVTADELPVANAGLDQVLDYTFGTTLSADIPSVGTGIWELVSGTGELFNAMAPSTQVNALSEGDNVFSWTVTNGACYPVTDYVTVKVNNLIIPTLITPNQDGANDYFVLRGLETLGRTELTIFDRRGLKVYENSDYDNSWEGQDYNSNPLADDTYFYVVRADNGISLSGYIVVRR